MRALRVEIDDLKKILDEEKPEWRDVSLDDLNTDDEDTATESGLAEHEERLAEENSRNAAQGVDPDYLATADALSRGLKVDGQATAPDDPVCLELLPIPNVLTALSGRYRQSLCRPTDPSRVESRIPPIR